MLQKTIQHTTRKISFSTDELKPWTEEDEQLINSYLKLHDKEQSLKERGKELLAKSSSLNKHTEKVRIALTALKTKISVLSKLADGFIIVNPAREQKAEQIIKQTDKVNNHTQAYHPLLSELADEADECAAINSAFIEDTENFDLWDDYTEIKSNHYDNEAVNSIDIVSFDNDDDMFRGYVSVCGDTNNSTIDYANSAIDNYSKLVLETEVQYGIWEEYLKRLTLIRMIIESYAGEIFASSN